MIVPTLEEFGVEDVEDLSFVEDTSLAREGVKEVPRRRFHAWIARLGGDTPPPPRDTSPRAASAKRDPASEEVGNPAATLHCEASTAETPQSEDSWKLLSAAETPLVPTSIQQSQGVEPRSAAPTAAGPPPARDPPDVSGRSAGERATRGPSTLMSNTAAVVHHAKKRPSI